MRNRIVNHLNLSKKCSGGLALQNLSKRNLGGFTIVELIIIITVMGILIILGTINMTDAQINARDAERKGDIESIAMNLETFYTSGTDDSTDIGYYPSQERLTYNASQYLPDLNPEALQAPGSNDSKLFKTSAPTTAQYGYQCTSYDVNNTKCRNFTLYYHTEKPQTGCTDNICIVTSKNQ